MPNWTQNRVVITGEEADVNALVTAVKSEESPFDFDRIIPLPKELEIPAGSDMSIGLEFLQKHPDGKPRQGEEPPTEKQLDLGRKALENIRKYGSASWYDWCINNWGTKWNAAMVNVLRESPNRVVFTFDTAWAAPLPIAEALVSQFGKVWIEWRYLNEEDWSEDAERDLRQWSPLI